MAIAALLVTSACLVVPSFGILDALGSYRTADASRCIEMYLGEGGARVLRVVPGPSPTPFRAGIPRSYDTTAVVWLNAYQVMFSSSPIYGEGGLWLYNLRTRRVDEVIPVGRSKELEYRWTKLIAVTATDVACWVADAEKLNEDDLEHTAQWRSFRWTLRLRPLRPPSS
jgi:hypothetical protein